MRQEGGGGRRQNERSASCGGGARNSGVAEGGEGEKPALIRLVNYSTLLTDNDLASWASALQQQVSQDFAPIWGVDATSQAVSKDSVDPAQWVLGVFDNSDQAGALGYHDLTLSGFSRSRD